MAIEQAGISRLPSCQGQLKNADGKAARRKKTRCIPADSAQAMAILIWLVSISEPVQLFRNPEALHYWVPDYWYLFVTRRRRYSSRRSQ
jgi:hypothetical protein